MWLNFYEYRRQREHEVILNRINAKGAIETDQEWAVYQEMAKQKIEGESEMVKIPITIDRDDIMYLSQFMPQDWATAYSFKYNKWLEICSKAKDANKAEEIPNWIFTPPTAHGGKVYFVYIGGMNTFYKLDAQPDDLHFGQASGAGEERQQYKGNFNYPHGGLYGYDLSNPVAHKKDNDDFDYEDVGEEDESEDDDTLEPGEEQYSFEAYEGLPRKRAGILLQNYLRRTAEGWNTLSQPFSGKPFSNDKIKEKFLSLPQRKVPRIGRSSKRDTSAPVLTAGIIEKKFNGDSQTGNEARMAALSATDEPVLNDYGLSKYDWMCVNCRKPVASNDVCPECHSNNIKKNTLFDSIKKMAYSVSNEAGPPDPNAAPKKRGRKKKSEGETAEVQTPQTDMQGVGERVYPIIVKRKVIRKSAVIPYMVPQRMISLTDWEQYEPKTLKFYKPQIINGEKVQKDPLYQKIIAVRIGMQDLDKFFGEVRSVINKDAEDIIEEIDNEQQKKGDRTKFIKQLGDRLAEVWSKLELKKLVTQNHIQNTDIEGFEKVCDSYLNSLTGKAQSVISNVKTGDVYDANMRQRQMNKNPNTFHWYGGTNLGFNSLHQEQESRNATPEFTDRWHGELIKHLGQGDSDLHRELYTVEPFFFEKSGAEIARAMAALKKLEAAQKKLIDKQQTYPKDTDDYRKLGMTFLI